jgi:predicted nucleotidyltransferase
MLSVIGTRSIQRLRDTLNHDETVVLAVLYGSGGRDRLAAHSDIDLAIAKSTTMSMDEKAEMTVRLEKAAGRTVDLVDLRVIEGVILHQVLTRGVVLKNADSGLRAFLIKKALYHDADMMPLLRRMPLAKAKRFAHGQGPDPEETGSPSHMRRAHRA